VGSGAFTATANDVHSGLRVLNLPDTVQPGQRYMLEGLIEVTRTRRYDFDAGSTFSDTVAITATDQADNLAGLPFQVIRDTTPPTVSLT
jgi:hypothetical protein